MNTLPYVIRMGDGADKERLMYSVSDGLIRFARWEKERDAQRFLKSFTKIHVNGQVVRVKGTWLRSLERDINRHRRKGLEERRRRDDEVSRCAAERLLKRKAARPRQGNRTAVRKGIPLWQRLLRERQGQD